MLNQRAPCCVSLPMRSVHAVARDRPPRRRVGRSLVRLIGGAAVLALLVRQVGAAPFRAGLQAVTLGTAVSAVGLGALTTVASAWRWRVVARALGMPLPLPTAIGAYYRSQLLNSVLPGGVLGDVHRAVTHGRRAGDIACGSRAVTWERLCGQLVSAVATAAVLLSLPSPIRPVVPCLLAAAAAALAVIGAVVLRGDDTSRTHRLARLRRVVRTDLSSGLLARRVWPQLLVTSVVVVAGHTTTFVIAARAVGAPTPTGELVPVLMLIQTAMVLPFSIGGWGPREGVAAWAFAAAGSGAAIGVTVTTGYAVLALIALSPGALLLTRDAVRRQHRTTAPTRPWPDQVRATLAVSRG